MIGEQKQLQTQQNDLLKKQRSQHEQLLQARFSQAQVLNMQRQQLIEKEARKTMEQGTGTERNGIDQETETELNSSEDKHTETIRSDSKDSQTSPMSSRRTSINEVNDE